MSRTAAPTRLRLAPGAALRRATPDGDRAQYRVPPLGGRWYAARVTAALLLSTAAVLPALAQSPRPETDAIRRQLESRKHELKDTSAREAALAQDVAEIDAERERINSRLLETASLIQKSEAKMSAIESRLGELEAQERIVRGSLEQRHGQIAKLLGALQRMGRNPPPVMITRRSDALQMVRSAMLLAAAFPELRGKALQLAGRLQELVRVMDEIRKESEQLKTETARLSDARTKLAGLMEERKQSLAQRKSELADVRRAAADIARSVTDLNELIVRLDKAVTEHTGLGAYEKEAQTAEVAPAPAPQATPSAASAPIVVPVPDTVATAPPLPAQSETRVAMAPIPKPSEVVELRPGHGAGVRADPGRIKPAVPFHLARGRLPLPAHGERVLNFNDKTQYGSQSKGVVLETRANAQITAPCDGWIVFAGEFRSYGQLLIINAGGGYHILLAGLSRIDVEPGQFVLAAEPVGTMGGASAARDGKNDSSSPVLYIEFRKDGRPIDPSPWWASGPEKVQG